MITEGHRQTGAGDQEFPTADSTEIVIPADWSELHRVRAAIDAWLPPSRADRELAEDAVLVASEMATLAIERGDTSHPITVRARYTHSILVIEVTCHLADSAPDDVLVDLRDVGKGVEGLEEKIIESLSDRLTTEAASRRITMRSTLHIPMR